MPQSPPFPPSHWMRRVLISSPLSRLRKFSDLGLQYLLFQTFRRQKYPFCPPLFFFPLPLEFPLRSSPLCYKWHSLNIFSVPPDSMRHASRQVFFLPPLSIPSGPPPPPVPLSPNLNSSGFAPAISNPSGLDSFLFLFPPLSHFWSPITLHKIFLTPCVAMSGFLPPDSSFFCPFFPFLFVCIRLHPYQ